MIRVLGILFALALGGWTHGSVTVGPITYTRAPSITQSASGNAYTDGIMYPFRWDMSVVSPAATLTFSIPLNGDSDVGCTLWTAWQTLSSDQKTAIRSFYQYELPEILPFTYTEVTEAPTGPHGQVRYGRTSIFSGAQGQEPDTPSGTTACPPGTKIGGTVEFGNGGQYDQTLPGQWYWQSVRHETGHALGLIHPFSTADYPPYGNMPADQCYNSFTVMAYQTAFTGVCINSSSPIDNNKPTTLMRDDVTTLQFMYGATVNAVNTTFTWSSTTGEFFRSGISQYGGIAPASNIIYMNIVDAGGTDTVDVSNYSTNPVIDLQPCSIVSIINSAQLATIGGSPAAFNFSVSCNTAIENYIGSTGNDDLTPNQTTSGTLDGGTGTNTLRYPTLTFGSFSVSPVTGGCSATSGGKTDIWKNWSTVIFSGAVSKTLNLPGCTLT